MDLDGGYYAKCNKSGRERQILYDDITCMWSLERPDSEKQNRMVVTVGLAAGEKWGYGHREFFLL